MNTQLIIDHLCQVILMQKKIAKLPTDFSIQKHHLRDHKKLLSDIILSFNTQDNENLSWSKFLFSINVDFDAVGVFDTLLSEKQKVLSGIDRYIEDIQRELQEQRLTEKEILFITRRRRHVRIMR